MAKARRPYSELNPQARGWITRRARAAGKDPARVHAAYKGLETRAKNQYLGAVEHGLKARKKTEQKLTPEVFKKRSAFGKELKSEAGITPPAEFSLKDLGPIRPTDEYWEIEGHQEFDEDDYFGDT